MKRLVLVLIAVTVLAATAGCAGVLEEEPTGSAEVDGGGDETTDPEANERDETGDYPYSTDDGSLDVGELASRQATILDEKSYVVEQWELTAGGGGTYEESLELTVDGETRMQKREVEYEPATEESVLGSSTDSTWLYRESVNETLVRRADESDERYMVQEQLAPTTDEQHVRKEIRALLRSSEFERIDVDDAGDTTIATYRVTGMSNDFEHLYPLGDEFDEFVATISVSDDGIEHYTYEVEVTAAGATETVWVETTFSDVGETDLERPAWVDEGYEKAPEASISVTDGETVAVTLDAGEPLPENSTVTLEVGPDYYRANLDEAFEPGETLYLAVQAEEELLTSVGTEPDAGDAIDTTFLSVSLSTENGTVAYKGYYEG